MYAYMNMYIYICIVIYIYIHSNTLFNTNMITYTRTKFRDDGVWARPPTPPPRTPRADRSPSGSPGVR